jgi:hypothetical protein
MKKYLVFMFCLMFAVSFVACGKKNDSARQPEDVKNDEESAGHPQYANSESSSAYTSSSDSTSLISPSSDNSLDKLKNGDKVTVVSYIVSNNKCTIVLKFERGTLFKEVTIEGDIASDTNEDNLAKVLTKEAVAETNDGGKIHIAIGTDPSPGNAKVLHFYVFYNTPHSCSIELDTCMGSRYIETGWKLGIPWILEKDVEVTISGTSVKRKYSLGSVDIKGKKY